MRLGCVLVACTLASGCFFPKEPAPGQCEFGGARGCRAGTTCWPDGTCRPRCAPGEKVECAVHREGEQYLGATTCGEGGAFGECVEAPRCVKQLGVCLGAGHLFGDPSDAGCSDFSYAGQSDSYRAVERCAEPDVSGDGLDNDCDGYADEATDDEAALRCGVGLCLLRDASVLKAYRRCDGTGCSAAELTAVLGDAGFAPLDVCDGVDRDCSGTPGVAPALRAMTGVHDLVAVGLAEGFVLFGVADLDGGAEVRGFTFDSALNLTVSITVPGVDARPPLRAERFAAGVMVGWQSGPRAIRFAATATATSNLAVMLGETTVGVDVVGFDFAAVDSNSIALAVWTSEGTVVGLTKTFGQPLNLGQVLPSVLATDAGQVVFFTELRVAGDQDGHRVAIAGFTDQLTAQATTAYLAPDSGSPFALWGIPVVAAPPQPGSDVFLRPSKAEVAVSSDRLVLSGVDTLGQPFTLFDQANATVARRWAGAGPTQLSGVAVAAGITADGGLVALTALGDVSGVTTLFPVDDGGTLAVPTSAIGPPALAWSRGNSGKALLALSERLGDGGVEANVRLVCMPANSLE